MSAAAELDAVNEMLAAIGEEPVEELEILPPSGNLARSILSRTSRDLQEEGYWFNTEASYTLTPGADSTITVPANVLKIDGVEVDVIQRGDKLYDREGKTFEFSSEVECTVVLHLDWADLPSIVRRYVTALATETFLDSIPGSPGQSDARTRNLMRAQAAFKRAQIEAEDWNLLSTNQSIQSALRRS